MVKVVAVDEGAEHIWSRGIIIGKQSGFQPLNMTRV